MNSRKDVFFIINRLFNFKRFCLLIKKDFYTQYKTYLIAMGSIFAILFVVNLASIISAHAWNFNLVFYPLTLFIGGFVFTSFSFNELSQAQSRIFYLTIPASSLEKFISKLIISGPCYAVVSLLLYYIFSQIVFILTILIFGLAHTIFNPFDPTVWYSIRMYLILQSVFLLGAIYFKKNSFIKTIVALFILLVLLVVFSAAIIFFTGKIISFNHEVYVSLNFLKMLFQKNTKFPADIVSILNLVNTALYITLFYLFAPLLWVVSFFLLKEIEV